MTEYPTILVFLTHNTTTNEKLEMFSIVKYDQKDFKLEELKTYLSQFARADKVEPPEYESEKKIESSQEDSDKPQRKQKKPYAELYTDRHFNTHIADNEKAALVFYITG